MAVIRRPGADLPDVTCHLARYRRIGRESFFDRYEYEAEEGAPGVVEVDRRTRTGRVIETVRNDIGVEYARHVVSEITRLDFPETGEARWF